MILKLLKKNKKHEVRNSKRSEEVADIIDRMPTKFGVWVAVAVVVFAVLLLIFGWIIKYPDVVTGSIEITSNVSPVKLVANTSGKIQLTEIVAQDSALEGEIIALIKNTAITEEVEQILTLLKQLNPTTISNPEIRRLFPVSIQMQITDSENRLVQTGIEKQEKERQLLLALLTAYHDLCDNIKRWEEQYLFKAPFDGKVEFLNFWVNDQFIQSGTEVFSIIPQESVPIGQMLLPASGAGKVEIGNKVAIKLENYPYTEFGYIEGKVKSLSLVSQKYDSGTTKIDVYLVLVDMPQGLTTNYGEHLDFQYKIGGSADIVVKDRRLIERLFDNLKSKTR